MTAAEVLELEAVVADGSAEEATTFLRTTMRRRRPYVVAGVVSALAVVLAIVTERSAWLLLAFGWWALMLLVTALRRSRSLSWMRTIALRPGSLVRVEWRDHDLAVHRPASTVVFQYAGMELAGTSERLTMLWVHNTLGSKRRSVLSLPSALVPPEAVARFQHAGPAGEDPFDAAELPNVFRVPAGWPRASYKLSAARKAALGFLLLIEVLLLAVLVAARAWGYLAVALPVLAVGIWWARSFAFRMARRRLPLGSVAGADFAGGRIRLALPDQRLDLPESRLRNVLPVGADVVLFLFKRSHGGPVPVPRALVPDEEIDRLRRVAGRRPMSAVQRAEAFAGRL